MATPNFPPVSSQIWRQILISPAREMMVVRIRDVTRSVKVWWMETGPSGSAVEMEEKMTRASREEVDGRWLKNGSHVSGQV